EAMISGLGISSPTGGELSPRQSLSVNTKVFALSPSMRQERPPFTAGSEMSPRPLSTALPADFNMEEFRINLMRQISDKLESGLDRHFSQMISVAALPLSPATSDHDGSGSATANDENTLHQFKRLLRNSSAELERLRSKNQELRESNHKLELQRLESSHQMARLQDFELSNQLLLTRIKELESCASSVDSLESSSMNGHRVQQHQRSSSASNNTPQNQHILRLVREIASLTAERDALKIKSWELEKKPFAQQHQQRPPHFVDLENERNRLVEELGAKTVAMEDLLTKSDGLVLRAKEYEKRVWELEGQCTALEQECKALPKIRSDLVEMEARAVAADALVEKMQDMEGQVTIVKNLQNRINELETTNAELDHANWDLSERLDISNNQLILLTKEFETFRSKDKDDRRLDFLANKNRELEALLAEQSKISPDYKDQFERASAELEKIKVRLPQLEGQSKQVVLLRSKNLQLEKQIKTMEELEPRLEEIQKIHERNVYLENELGELEQLRAREMELEGELEEQRSRVTQLETNKGRVASLSGVKSSGARARSASIVQHHNPTTLQEDTSSLNVRTDSPPLPQPLIRRTSQSMSPVRATAVSIWPSGRRSLSLSNRSSFTSSTTGSPSEEIAPKQDIPAVTTTETPESLLDASDPLSVEAAPVVQEVIE
ncbi:hypothetical protein BGZ65_008304, partial [Modicella reniformis]